MEFFTIERMNISNIMEMDEHFHGFDNIYDQNSGIETDGVERWSEYENDSMRFETFTEAEKWFSRLDKDDYHRYSIKLKRVSNVMDRNIRKEHCGDMITLKTFLIS